MYSQYIKESGYFSFHTGGIAASVRADAPLAFIIANDFRPVKGLFLYQAAGCIQLSYCVRTE